MNDKNKRDPISTGSQPPPLDDNVSSQELARVAQTGEMAVPVKSGAKREHKATYARDKINGGYLVRVIGPHANRFGGKIVPVVKRDDSESQEALENVVWSGIDTGTTENPGTGKPVALYTFTQKAKGGDDILF